MSVRRVGALLLLLSTSLTVGSAQQEEQGTCSRGPAVAATVFAILLLLSLAVLAFVLYLYVWRPRHASGLEKVHLAEDGREEGRFAFDNPYLVTDDDDIGRKSTLPCDTVLSQNEKTNTARSIELRPDRRSPLNIFSPTSKVPRRRAADDSVLGEPERATVPLRGHDFSGLGFNICGNMRDGIHIRDLTQRGPAVESGLIKPGDRVTGLTVSFEHIVLEDALTILSYASPYELHLHLQKQHPPVIRKHQLTSQSSHPGQHLVHPIFRSQSQEALHRLRWTNYPLDSPELAQAGKQVKHAKPEKNSKSKTAEKQVSKASVKEPRVDTTLHVQRDAAGAHATEASTGFREMAVDVPDHMVASSLQHETETSSPGASKYSKLGVKVLPVPDLKSADLKSTQSTSHQAVEWPGPLTSTPRAAGGVKTYVGAESSPGADLHTFVHDSSKCPDVEKCLTMLANDIPCCELADVETGERLNTPQKRIPVRLGTSSFKRQNSIERDSVDLDLNSDATNEVGTFGFSANITNAFVSGDVERGMVLDFPHMAAETARIEVSPTTEVHVEDREESHHAVRPSSDDDVPPPVPPHADQTSSGGPDRDAICREVRHGSSASSSSAEHGDLMRLAAGAAQDRRNRADRRAVAAVSEVQQDAQVTVTLPAAVEDVPSDRGAPTTAALVTRTSAAPVDMGSPARMPYSAEVDMSAGQEVEITKVSWAVNKGEEHTDDSHAPMDKLDAFKEVLSMTPSRPESPRKERHGAEEDVVGETVERNVIQRSPEPHASTPRITGEVTGIVSVASVGPHHTTPRADTNSDINGHAETVENTADSSGRSQTEVAPPAPSTRRLLSDEGERISASTGDLSRLENRQPDTSSLERAVSLQMAWPEPQQPAASVAACQGPEMDLSQVGRSQEAADHRSGATAAVMIENGTTVHRRPSSSSSSSSSSSEEEAAASMVEMTSATSNGHTTETAVWTTETHPTPPTATSTFATTFYIATTDVSHSEPAAQAPPIPPTTRTLDPAPSAPAVHPTPDTQGVSHVTVQESVTFTVSPNVSGAREESEITLEGPHITPEGYQIAPEGSQITVQGPQTTSEAFQITPEQSQTTSVGFQITPERSQSTSVGFQITPEEFQITPEELDGGLISHGSYLRREAERRALACRLAGEDVKHQHESSPAPQ